MSTGPFLRALRRVSTLVLRACVVLTCAAFLSAMLLGLDAWHYIYIDRKNLPHLGTFTRFESSRSAAVVEQVLDELAALDADLDVDDLLAGDVQVYSTVDGRVQRIVSDALEHGLERYERRHPAARRALQGSVVVLNNRDGSSAAGSSR